MGEKQILSGNEAVSRGCWEAGCRVAAAYPGTPSSEILENIAALYKGDIEAQWAGNEKVAVEIALGASMGGARSIAAMKHVGMNVAADPIFTAAYTGVNGGFVIVSADDPGMHSSQNEQDNRLYAPHAKLLMLEPSDAAECRAYIIGAYELSERFDTPVLFRMTTRICHSKGIVEVEDRQDVSVKKYEKRTEKFTMLPVNAKKRHKIREELLAEAEAYANDCPYNRVEECPDAKIGVITSGVSYQYSREVFGDGVSYLKLGLTYPLPRKLIKEFASKYSALCVVEENDPYLENAVRALGFDPVGKDKIPILYELDSQIVKEALTGESAEEGYQVDATAPPRPPVMCAGCPHRGFFYTVSKKMDKIVPSGDIGCYTLGASEPFLGIDTCICMGSGLSTIIGMAKALRMQGDSRKPLGMLGDSTFFHTGVNSLIDVAVSQANVIAVILDNSITAMTGHQQNPGSGKNIYGEPEPSVDVVSIVRAVGIPEEHIRVVDPLDLGAMSAAIEEGVACEGPFVIVTRRPCVLIKEVAKASADRYCVIDPDKCIGCKMCMKIACPAIAFRPSEDSNGKGKAEIFDRVNCTACGLCEQMCKFGAIAAVGIEKAGMASVGTEDAGTGNADISTVDTEKEGA
ncbi:MAG: indolepyruvate ferredoxin oxidoreductase subunit alpha [Clostridiales Family XIII bacterium]|nr:indolepyruvate ferredoxin oxidoreductase subunit alpha [Clostridiales Family XIII bacterium]